MVEEIEAKILGIDKPAVERRILALGGRKIFEGLLDVRVFDFRDERLRKARSLLRVRKEGEGCKMAFKRHLSKRGGVKRADETELSVTDFGRARKLLLALGLREVIRAAKFRTSYSLRGARIDIDSYKGIPAYLEIEAGGRAKIEEAAGLLGFGRRALRAWSVGRVFRHYGVRYGDH